MKLIVPTLVLMTALSYTQAMYDSDDSYDLDDIQYSPIPATDLTGAVITKFHEGNATIFEALFGAGNQIIVRQNASTKTEHEYVGEHLFTSQKGSQLSVDLLSEDAHDLFDQYATRHATQAQKQSSTASDGKK